MFKRCQRIMGTLLSLYNAAVEETLRVVQPSSP